jgi:predicted phage-related endonuclease
VDTEELSRDNKAGLKTLTPKLKGANTMSNETIRMMEQKARALREMQALIEEAQAEAESLKDDIKALMGDSEEVKAGEYKITWKTVESVRLDSKALKTQMPDIYAAFAKETTTRRFCVA